MTPAADRCICGHPASDHVRLPGYPGGCEECRTEGCDCGRYRDALDEPFDYGDGPEEW